MGSSTSQESSFVSGSQTSRSPQVQSHRRSLSTRKQDSSPSLSSISGRILSIKDDDSGVVSAPLIEAEELEMTEEGNKGFSLSPPLESQRLIAKVIVIGNASVGKTSIIQTFVKKKIVCDQIRTVKKSFNPSIDELMTTVLLGVGEGGFREMHLQLWESRLPKPHHRDADACILVSDLSNLSSLLTIRTHQMQFSSYVSNGSAGSSPTYNRFPYFIVGNKKDLSHTTSSLLSNSTHMVEELLITLFLSFLADYFQIQIPQNHNFSVQDQSQDLKTGQFSSSFLSSLNSLPLFQNSNNFSYLIDLIIQYWRPNVRDDLYRLSEQLKGETFVGETSTIVGQESSVTELFKHVVDTVTNRLIALEK